MYGEGPVCTEEVPDVRRFPERVEWTVVKDDVPKNGGTNLQM